MNTAYNGDYPYKSTRQRLDELCKPPFDDPKKYVDVFFPEFSFLLEAIAPPPPRNHQFNCFAYALELGRWVHSKLVAELIAQDELTSTDGPELGDIAIYFDKLTYLPTHAGKLSRNSKIISKWAGGPTFEHDPFVAPLSYGNQIEFYSTIDTETAQQLLREYEAYNVTSAS